VVMVVATARVVVMVLLHVMVVLVRWGL